MGLDERRTDRDLLDAVVAGDGAAFSIFYRRHLAAVVGFLYRETRDREVAADLAAEVFAATFVYARRFAPHGDGSAGPWVRGIAQNKLRESRRRGRVEDRARRRLALVPEPLDDADLERVDDLASLDRRNTLELLEQLPADQRTAIRSRVIEEQDYREIAKRLRCSELVVRQRVSRGLSWLQRQMEANSNE